MLPAQTLLFVCNASNDAAPWIHLSLGLRHANTSLWALSAGGVDAAPAFEEWLPFFFPEGACA